MHIAGKTYDELTATFRWELPARFNIAEAVCDRHARATPDAPALIVEDSRGDPVVWNFATIKEKADRLANALAALGVGPGVVVAIHLTQCPEALLAHVAVQKLGALALPLFGLFGSDAVAFRLADSGARVIVTSAAHIERVASALANAPALAHVVSIDGPGPFGAKGFWELVDAASSTARSADTGIDDPAILMYTSGTTGNPKGVLHAQRVLIGHLPGVVVPHMFFPRSGDKFWTPADWAWAGGLLDVLLPSLLYGVPVVVARHPRFDPEAAFELIARHGVRNLFIPPTALRLMRQVLDPMRRYGHRVRSIFSGGEKLGEDMIAWGREAFGITLSEAYGQTEVNLVVGNCPEVFPVKAGSMGRPLPGHSVAVVDNDGREVGIGEPGIVAVRRPDPVMFLEYWRQPAATKAKFRGQWCLLGDIAIRDGDGYLWFQGRDDDIINSAGYRIGPGEIEECLAAHPAVTLAGVIGAPDPIRGEVIVAFVVPAKGVTPTPELAADIQAHVKASLAAHEAPRRIRFIAEMPMTVTGKIRRMDLRQMDRELEGAT